MNKFVVSVEGKILVSADDKDGAKTVAKGILARHAPWLDTSYSTATQIADEEEIALKPIFGDDK